jgi:hypothetical protein
VNCSKHPQNPSWWGDKRRCYECAQDNYAQDSLDRDLGKAPWERDQNGRYDDVHHSDINHPATFPREERTIWRGGRK